MGVPGDDVTTRTGPRGYVEPTFGQRLLARLIDGLIVVALLTPLWLVTSGRVRVAAFLVVAGAYEIGLVATRGRTIGKYVMGTRVIDSTYGDAPSTRQAAQRWLVLFSGGFVGLIDPDWASLVEVTFFGSAIPILLPPLHRGLHDRWSGTIVTAPSEPLSA